MSELSAVVPVQKNPDEQVAENIGEALLAAGFLDASKKNAVVSKISSGLMKTSDWKSLFEMSKSKGGK